MFFFASPRQRTWRGSACTALGLALWLGLSAAVAAAPSSAEQRAAFKRAYAVALQGGDDWKPLAAGLRAYPLYAYLPAAAMEHDIRQVDRAQVEAYLKAWPDAIPADDLRRSFLRELARREDWSDFRAMYQPGLGDALACDALRAQLADGGVLSFEQDLAALWADPSLPAACNPILDMAHEQGLLTSARLWSRIDRAVDAGKGGTVASLARWLPATERATAQDLARAMRDPARAVADAASWPDDRRHRQAATLALVTRAQDNVADAEAAWQQLQPHFSFSQTQRDRILRAVALFRATDFVDDALARFRALPAAAQSDATRAWRVRVALARKDWSTVLAGIEAMPTAQKQDGEWQYFRGRALAALGRAEEAQQQFAAQASHATYYGFLAADQLDQAYAICPSTLADDSQRRQALLAKPGLRRAFELFAVDLPRPARREWNRALAGADRATMLVAADLAHQRGWYDRAIFILSSGDALHMYDLRYPLASQDGLVAQAAQAGIAPAWAYAIVRAESAWMTDARSGANARGLMQLLPATAAQVAKRHGLSWGGVDTLYDPRINIMLGTRYLAQLADRFGGSPWLASAAYNAGPNRVDEWLAARGTLPPDVFVATIPYKETRAYVARVMAFSVIYDWRLHGNAVPLATRMSVAGATHLPPHATTRRRAVSCPVAAPELASRTSIRAAR